MTLEEQRRLVEAQRPRTIISGPGVRGDGRNFSVTSETLATPTPGDPLSYAIAPPLLGFQVIMQNNGGTLQWGVWFGKLYNVDNSLVTVTGLLASVDSSDASWLNIGGAGSKIWIELAISSGVIVSAYINNSGFAGGVFEYVSDGAMSPSYSQTYHRFILSESYTDAGGHIAITNRAGDKQVYNGGATALDSGSANPQQVPVLFISQ